MPRRVHSVDLKACILVLRYEQHYLAQALKKPTRKCLLHGDTLNPYIVIILTFLSTVMKSEFSPIFERAVLRKELADFLSTVPRKIIRLEIKSDKEFALLTSGCSPLPEDARI
jgi:protein SMG6